MGTGSFGLDTWRHIKHELKIDNDILGVFVSKIPHSTVGFIFNRKPEQRLIYETNQQQWLFLDFRAENMNVFIF